MPFAFVLNIAQDINEDMEVLRYTIKVFTIQVLVTLIKVIEDFDLLYLISF